MKEELTIKIYLKQDIKKLLDEYGYDYQKNFEEECNRLYKELKYWINYHNKED